MSKREVWVYYVTRNSYQGKLADKCDLWSWRRPARENSNGNVLWGPKTKDYLGTHPVDYVRAWFNVVPDTDLECLVVEQYAVKTKSKPKPNQKVVSK